VRQSAVAIAPFGQQLLAQGDIHGFVRDLLTPKHHLQVRGNAMCRPWSPAKSSAIKQRVPAVIGGRHVHDQASADFCDHLPVRVHARSPRAASANATAPSQERFVEGKSGQLD